MYALKIFSNRVKKPCILIDDLSMQFGPKGQDTGKSFKHLFKIQKFTVIWIIKHRSISYSDPEVQVQVYWYLVSDYWYSITVPWSLGAGTDRLGLWTCSLLMSTVGLGPGLTSICDLSAIVLSNTTNSVGLESLVVGGMMVSSAYQCCPKPCDSNVSAPCCLRLNLEHPGTFQICNNPSRPSFL